MTTAATTTPRTSEPAAALAEAAFCSPEWLSYTMPCPWCEGRELSIKGLFAKAEGQLPPELANIPEHCTCSGAQAHTAARIAEQAETDLAARQARQKRLFAASGMPQPFKARTLALWQRNTPAAATAYAAAVEFARHIMLRQPASLFIAGDIGTGKTFLASCLARDLIRRGREVKWANVGDFFRTIKRAFLPNSKESEGEIMACYTKPPILVLDDLGKERPTEWGAEQLFALINARYDKARALIVTTNYGGEELIRRLTPRAADGIADDTTARAIVDRLREVCKPVILTGASWRSQQKAT